MEELNLTRVQTAPKYRWIRMRISQQNTLMTATQHKQRGDK